MKRSDTKLHYHQSLHPVNEYVNVKYSYNTNVMLLYAKSDFLATGDYFYHKFD